MTQGIANQGTNRLIVEAFAQRHPDMTHISALALQKLLGVSQSRTMLESDRDVRIQDHGPQALKQHALLRR
ncbi:MAG: hypothetical protein R3F58_00665 [Steroidobacteraceae bacterium]